MAAEDDVALRHDVSLKMAIERPSSSRPREISTNRFVCGMPPSLVVTVAVVATMMHDAEKRASELGEGVDDDARFFRASAEDLMGSRDEAEEDFAALPSDREYMVHGG